MARRALAIAAHPDDIEFAMAGTLILLGRAGYELHYMTIANGSCGTVEQDVETIVGIRREESRRAASVLGAQYHESLVDDINIYYEPKLLARVGAVVRQVGPEIMLVPSPRDYMEDHMNACRLAVTAAFCRGMRNFAVEPATPPIDQEVAIYHAQPHGNCDELGRPVRPGIFVDVSDVLDAKAAALAEHRSQKTWLDKSQGMDSYLHMMRDLSRDVGRLSGRFEYAEGWRRHYHVGLCAEGADPLVAAIKDSVLVGPKD